MIKKDPTTSIRKHANELRVHDKTVKTIIKRDLSPNINSVDYAIWSILKNKINPISHSNIVSLKTAIEKEWNKIFQVLILKACKSIRKRVDTTILKKWQLSWANLLFSVYLLT